MGEISQMELDLLRMRADAAGCYVNRHKQWDPARGDGQLYLQAKRKFRGERTADLLRYATADQIHAELTKIEKAGRV